MLPALAFVMVFSARAYNVITDLPEYYHHGIFLFCWNIGFMIILALTSRFIIDMAADSQIIKYFKWLGENVTVVYIVQWLIIGNLATRIHGTQYFLSLVFWFAGILAVTSVICYVYLKLRSNLKS